MLRLALFTIATVFSLRADVSGCACDPAKPDTMKARECSLCAEAEKHASGEEFFLLKDSNPRKPNRWLVLPKAHGAGGHHLHEMSRQERTRFWKFAIEQARNKFGDEWAVAYNGHSVRTQCHAHLHVGRLIQAAKIARFNLVKRIEDFPAPDDSGIWVYPAPGGFRVHLGEQVTETALVR
jgi:diadenosine tetraphosphate (Ap4A) HIT family hydrolase